MQYNVEHRIHFTRREEHNTLQSHLLVPVSMNGRSGFLFSSEHLYFPFQQAMCASVPRTMSYAVRAS